MGIVATFAACSCDLIFDGDGEREAYWALVESYRTERGPRQRTVAYLGLMDEAGRLGVEQAAEPQPASPQQRIVPGGQHRAAVRRDRPHAGAGRKLPRVRRALAGLELVEQLGLKEFLDRTIPPGQESPWSLMALMLVLAVSASRRANCTSPNIFTAKARWPICWAFRRTRSTTTSVSRAGRDAAAQRGLGNFLKNRLGELFGIEYDLLAVRRDQHVFRGPGQRQSAGPTRLLARSSARLQAGLHRVGRDPVRHAAGLRSFRGKRHESRRCRRSSRRWRPLRPGRSHLGARSRHGVGREHRLFEAKRTALHRGHAEEHAQAVRAEVLRKTGVRSATAWRSSCVLSPTMAMKPMFFAGAATAARKKRRCTAVSSGESRRGCKDRGRLPKRRHAAGPIEPAWDACWDRTRGPSACSTCGFALRKTVPAQNRMGKNDSANRIPRQGGLSVHYTDRT